MKILVVDDSIFVRQYIKKYLLEANITNDLDFATTGEEGYEAYLNSKPDLIITDLLMPGMGGEAFIKKIRETDNETKIIVLTADIQKSVMEDIMKLNVIGFLNKPINNSNMLNTLVQIIKEQ